MHMALSMNMPTPTDQEIALAIRLQEEAEELLLIQHGFHNRGGDLNEDDIQNLHTLTPQTNTEVIKVLLKYGIWSHDYYTVIQEVLERTNFNINNTIDNDQNTLLHLAAHWNNHNTINYLLETGANKNIKNLAGETALHCALKGKEEAENSDLYQTTRLMLNIGGPLNINAKNTSGATPLLCLIEYCCTNEDYDLKIEKTFQELIDYGATIDNSTIGHTIDFKKLHDFLKQKQLDIFLKKHAPFISHEGHIQPKPDTQKKYWDNNKDIRNIQESIQTYASELYTPLTLDKAIKLIQEYKNKEEEKTNPTSKTFDLIHSKLKNTHLKNKNWFNLYCIDQGNRCSKLTKSTKPNIKDLPKDILSGLIAEYLLPKFTKHKCKQWLNPDVFENASSVIAYRGFSALIENHTQLTIKLRTLDARLIEAARSNNLEDIKTLIAQKASVLGQDKEGKTALHYAAINSNEDAIQELLKGDHQLVLKLKETKDNQGNTPCEYRRDSRLLYDLLATENSALFMDILSEESESDSDTKDITRDFAPFA